jgi:O-acetyl-ADP-ribose deacetylase (regulator of RNase III)
VITPRLGDITSEVEVDAIVNAANSCLLGGGGIDGAIHDAPGPALLQQCQALGGCEPGDAKTTGAGDLAVRYIIHAGGPVWHGGTRGEAALLASCDRRAIELADEHNCSRVAFPAISTGAYGSPLPDAARIALTSTTQALVEHPDVREARFWLFDDYTHDVFLHQLGRIRLADPGAASE